MTLTPARISGALCATLFVLSPLVSAAQGADRRSEPARPYSVYEFRGIDALLGDEKDRALRDALGHIGDRVLDLPAELGSPGLLSLGMPVLVRALSGPHRYAFATGLDFDDLDAVGLNLEFEKASAEEASELAEGIQGLSSLLGLGFEEPAPDGLAQSKALSELWFGAVGTKLVVRFGTRRAIAFPDFAALLPDEAELATGYYAQTGPVLDEYLEDAPLSARKAEVVEDIASSFGLDRAEVTLAGGRDERGIVRRMRIEQSPRMLRRLGLPGKVALDREFLRVVPSDATWAVVVSADLGQPSQIVSQLLQAHAPGVRADLAALEKALGGRLHKTLFAALTGRFALFGSERAGGGPFSTVLVAELADPEAMRRMLDILEALVDERGRQELGGYLAFVTTEVGDVRVETLRVPGLPIPSPLALSVVGEELVVALGPRQALAVSEHLRSGEGGLADAPGFPEQLGTRSPNGLSGIFWLDTPGMLSAGYEVMGLATSAIANAVASPAEPTRGTPILLPTPAELRRGAKPTVGWMEVGEGETWVTVRRDPSALVNWTADIGWMVRSPFGAAIALGLGMDLARERWDEFLRELAGS
ncbi:MAG TPA: hypothetical protein ENJ09_00540 [Planctomycetes bacterium]|nr:hypothetical protein [Planctomycetota bacterium]